MPDLKGFLFWGFLLVFGSVMYLIAPRAAGESEFFAGQDGRGRTASPAALTMSIFISWIFAKSVTNAVNLGAEYGIVGGLAYATYWLSIPLAGVVIHRLRTREGATGIVAFLVGKYGRGAALSFSMALVVRLFNEVWSNTAVVGSYFGPAGSPAFIGSALLLTAAVLLYSLKGGLRSSIFSDVIQAVVFVFFVGVVLAAVLPGTRPAALLSQGRFALDAGLDLLLVAALQTLSYPFHDPVLTDRGFITPERTMLRAFIVAGVLGFAAIFAFSLVGVHARLEGLAASGNVAAKVTQGLGLAAFFAALVVMVTSAASTLDSTFTSLSKLVARDLPQLAGRRPLQRPMIVGALAMTALAVLGNLPMLAGTDLLEATTLSGTMVIGLAPIFLFSSRVGYSPLSFHLAFWSGIAFGVLQVVGRVPPAWAVGRGSHALLLGTNLYGLLFCTAAFFLPRLFDSARRRDRPELPCEGAAKRS